MVITMLVILNFLLLNSSGQMVEFIKEHPDNEYFWEVKNENGEIGYVPSTHVLVKEQHVSIISEV